MSVIDVRRVVRRGSGSGGGERPADRGAGASDGLDGKTNIDCGRDERADVGEVGLVADGGFWLVVPGRSIGCGETDLRRDAIGLAGEVSGLRLSAK
jgi:hypothetical protein